MSEMAELSELYEESSDLQMDVMPGEGDLPQMEEGPMEEEEAQPMAAPEGKRSLANGPNAGEQPGQVAGADFESEDEGEEFDDWEDDYDYPEEEQLSGAGYRVSAALEEADKMFLRTREPALDGGFQMHYEKTPFDQLAFIEELFSLMVVNRLTEELGCDEIIDRE
ncbi:EP300 interacting inhibitor of differentiation 1 [Homo sapiens]|uniref:EP300 interacting inhibitor of differentiation 1 n=2 Tax=Hominidae TaxID=9604 RepID=H0YN68_HUMAN|nr:EP300 interacting inhibitor of differentiation 1 [Homo sapiens]KAI4057715.1 EP300 interacting inhibitor of differentiation 1 [Homo sapiens]PNJ54820.1 EID1 isoform 2 [Pongo abelii]